MLKPGGPPHPGGKQPAAVIIERLHFDARQQAQYQQQIRAHQEQTRRLNDQSVELYRQYYGLLTASQPDMIQANGLSRQIGDIQRMLAEVNFRHFQAIKALCHPDQQADFDRLVAELSQLFGRQQRPERSGLTDRHRARPVIARMVYPKFAAPTVGIQQGYRLIEHITSTRPYEPNSIAHHYWWPGTLFRGNDF